MATTDKLVVSPAQLDNVAWQFLRSDLTGETYAQWPIDRRLDAFLLHHGYRKLHDDGSAYNALLDRVMANIGTAVRIGVVSPPRRDHVS